MAVGVTWKLLFNSNGWINSVLMSIGLTDAPIAFLGDTAYALPAIMVADTWQWTPFIVILCYAALVSLPRSVFEAAAIDGAYQRQTLFRVILPMLWPQLLAIFLIRVIIAFKTFDLIYVLTFGGPGNATNVSSFEIWKTAMREFDLGLAAAQTLMLAIVVTPRDPAAGRLAQNRGCAQMSYEGESPEARYARLAALAEAPAASAQGSGAAGLGRTGDCRRAHPPAHPLLSGHVAETPQRDRPGDVLAGTTNHGQLDRGVPDPAVDRLHPQFDPGRLLQRAAHPGPDGACHLRHGPAGCGAEVPARLYGCHLSCPADRCSASPVHPAPTAAADGLAHWDDARLWVDEHPRGLLAPPWVRRRNPAQCG